MQISKGVEAASQSVEFQNVKSQLQRIYRSNIVKTMKIFKCGTRVKTHIGNQEAIITAANIRFNRVAYELSYFNNGEYKTCWCNDSEFDPCVNYEKNSIGYKH